jgi:hypothetical protein
MGIQRTAVLTFVASLAIACRSGSDGTGSNGGGLGNGAGAHGYLKRFLGAGLR